MPEIGCAALDEHIGWVSCMAQMAQDDDIKRAEFRFERNPGSRSAKLEQAMSITQIERCREPQSHPPQRIIARFAATGRMIAMGAGLAAMTLAAVPVTAQAKDGNAEAAIGLGILGGVIARAAIASTASPVYAAPLAYYPYPQPSYYYSLPPTYYYSPYPYSTSAGYSYPPYDYR